MSDPRFVCPQCGASLTDALGDITCTGCDRSWPTRLGVTVFSDPDFYYGEVPRDRMREALAPGPDKIEEVKAKLAEARGDWFPRYAFATNRADWRVPLGVPHGGRVLDYGCGLGAVSMGLAPHFDEVCAVDPTPERAALLALRASAHGRDNVVAAAADIETIPFAEESFDLVVVMGVLEWTPLSYTAGSPREVELDQLRRLARFLKPGGTLVLGIENRIGVRYFIGGREEHTDLRFVSLLPRRLADVYSNLIRKSPYRNWTYSPRGTTHLLTEAGFDDPQAFGAWFHYSFPDLVYPVSLKTDRARRLARGLPASVNEHWRDFKAFPALRAGFERSRSFRSLAPSLLVAARKPGSPIFSRRRGRHETLLPSRNESSTPMRTIRFEPGSIRETSRSRDEDSAAALISIGERLEAVADNRVVPSVTSIERDAEDVIVAFEFIDGPTAEDVLEDTDGRGLLAGAGPGLAALAVAAPGVAGAEAAKEASALAETLGIDGSALESRLLAAASVPCGFGHADLDLARVIAGDRGWVVTDWDLAREAVAPFEGLITIARAHADRPDRVVGTRVWGDLVALLGAHGIDDDVADAGLRLAVLRRAVESSSEEDVRDAEMAAHSA